MLPVNHYEAGSTSMVPKLAVITGTQVFPWKVVSDVRDPVCKVLPYKEALETVWPDDAHIQSCIHLDNDGTQPRLAKKVGDAGEFTATLERVGPVATFLVFADSDMPKVNNEKQPLTPEVRAAVDRSLWDSGLPIAWYHTAHGSHFVGLSDTPIATDDFEAKVLWFIDLINQIIAETGLKPCDQLKDWSRLMRAPFVTREGAASNPSLELSRLTPMAFGSKVKVSKPFDSSKILVTGWRPPISKEVHDKAVAFYKERIGAHNKDYSMMAFQGGMARAGFRDDDIAQLSYDFTEATFKKGTSQRTPEVRRAQALNTCERLRAGDRNITGWPKLAEYQGQDYVNDIKAIFDLTGWCDKDWLGEIPKPIIKPSPKLEYLPARNPEHAYSYVVGEVAALTDQKKAPASDLAAWLKEDYRWKNVLRWDETKNHVVAVNPPLELGAEKGQFCKSDGVAVQCWFESLGIKASDALCFAVMERIARQCPWNPILDDMKRCADEHPEDGAIDEMCTQSLHLAPDDWLSRDMVRRQLIASGKRTARPGTKCDTMLIFRSRLQGFYKDQFLEDLFGAQYVTTRLSDIRSKDAMMEIRGMRASSFGELGNMSSAKVTDLKEWLSRRFDKFRSPYDRSVDDVARTTCFFGTTNESWFLKDLENRRFWVVNILQAIDVEWVKKNRDRVWAEVYRAVLADEQHWYDQGSKEAKAAEARCQDYRIADDLTDWLRAYLSSKTHAQSLDVFKQLRAEELIQGGFGHEAQALIRNLFDSLGWVYRNRREDDGSQKKSWWPPEDWDARTRVAVAESPEEPEERKMEPNGVKAFLDSKRTNGASNG